MVAVTRPRVQTVQPRDLVDRAQRGEIRIPAFQRSYRWERNDVTELFDSIFRGYPISNLLFWQRPAPAEIVTIGHLIVEAPALGDALWVVDGQQRITSLVGALTATEDTVDPRFRIYFDLSRGEFVSVSRGRTAGPDLLPVSVALNTAAANAWIRARQQLTDEQIALADQVVAAIRDYEIPMYVVTGDDERALRNIFDRMNTFGKSLKSSEVFNALHSLAGHREPSDLHTLSASVRTFGFGELSEQILMQSLLAIRDPKVDRDFRDEFKDNKDLHEALVSTETALGHVVDFLRNFAQIPHIRLVPYALYVPVLARFSAFFGPPVDRAAELLRRWIWRGAVLGVAPQGNTVGLRQGAAAVYEDPVESAERLLRLLPTQRGHWIPDLSQTRLNRAQAKVNALGLLSLQPRMISPHPKDADGAPVDAVQLLEEGSLFVQLVATEGDLGAGIANRTIYPAGHADRLHGMLLSGEVRHQTLASHCLNAQSVHLMRTGQIEDFLKHRAKITRMTISAHVQNMALFGFRDGPDVAALFDEENNSDQ